MPDPVPPRPDARSALLVVDVQNGFCTGGQLAVRDGEAVVPVINRIAAAFENVVLTRTSKKSVFADVTNQLTSMVVGYCRDEIATIDGVQYCVADALNPVIGSGDVDWTRIALFAGNTQDWFWNFDNNGLRLTQLRFYELCADRHVVGIGRTEGSRLAAAFFRVPALSSRSRR